MTRHRLIPLLLFVFLATVPPACGQTESPGGDPPDQDALDRIAKSDVVTAATGGPITRSGNQFLQDGHNFVPKGVNFELSHHFHSLWDTYDSLHSEVDEELDRARRLGGNVVRVFLTGDNFGGTPAIYDVAKKDSSTGHVYPSALLQLDDFLTRADAHGLKVLLTLYDGLNDFRMVNNAGTVTCRGQIGNPHSDAWPWQNTSPDNNANTWAQGPDIRPYRWHADDILTVKIPGTNRVFANDPRIFGWDILNEPDHLFNKPSCVGFYSQNFVNAWIGWMARHVHLYTQAPITAGTYGWFLNPGDRDRGTINFNGALMTYTVNGVPHSLWNDLDFISIHWYQPKDRLQSALTETNKYMSNTVHDLKPILIEEIGQADNGWYFDNTCWQQTMPNCKQGDVSCNRTWIHGWTLDWTGIAKSNGISGLVWTGSDFPDENKLWCGQQANRSNEYYFGLYDGGGALKPAGQAFAPSGSDTACVRAGFVTADGRHWLTAQLGGGPGSSLDASSTTVGTSSTFTLVRLGDAVHLKIVKNGISYYVSANQGGASYLTVDQTKTGNFTGFGLVDLGYVSGLGDNAVAFRTAGYNGVPYYVSASGTSVNANARSIQSGQTFRMVCQP